MIIFYHTWGGIFNELLLLCVSNAKPLENCINECVIALLSVGPDVLGQWECWVWLAPPWEPEDLKEPWVGCPAKAPWEQVVWGGGPLVLNLNLAGTTLAAESLASKVMTQAATTIKPMEIKINNIYSTKIT